MKKLFFTIVLLVVASCTVEVTEDYSLGEGAQLITITATHGDPDTRTERTDGGRVLWSSGDRISVFYGSGIDGGSQFTSQNTESARVAQFVGSINVISGGHEVAIDDNYFWALYPYDPMASCDGYSVTTVLPSNQAAMPDTFADDLFPTLGRSKGLSIPFYNICGGIKFTLSEEGIKSVILKGNNGEILAGKIKVGFDDTGKPIVLNITDGTDAVTVSVPDGETLEVGRAYYIVIVPTVFESGFSLTFNKADSQSIKYHLGNVNIKRSVFGVLTTPDKDLEWGELSYVQIPDPNFNAYMIQNFDSNGNGVLDFSEAESVNEINVCTDEIMSLIGIEYCPNLQKLACSGSSSKWNKTENRFIHSGKLAVLDVSKNTALSELSCNNNLISSLDLSHNTALTNLTCNTNQLTSLNVSNNIALSRLSCAFNQLLSLDVSSNASLEFLDCQSNHLVSLNTANCSGLKTVYCGNDEFFYSLSDQSNAFEDLDFSSNISLISLSCTHCHLSNIDVGSCSVLKSLTCSNNQLSTLDISANTNLTLLICEANQLQSLDLSANALLSTLKCDYNQLTTLDISNNDKLITFFCYNNQLTFLDVSNNYNLSTLYCDSNNLSNLVVGDNSSLVRLTCSENHLTTLNVSGCSSLYTLDCRSNPVLAEIWIGLGQTIDSFEYDKDIAAIKYKGLDYAGMTTEISTADGLVDWLLKANLATTGEYRITATEIDMAGKTFAPSLGFAGVLDGNGCVIKNLSSGTPLFNNLRGTVKNLVFDNSCCFSPTVPVFGAIADESYGLVSGIVNNAEVIYAEGSIDEANSTITFGSLVGSNYGTVENCCNTAAVTLHYSTLSKDKQSCIWGGLVGYTAGAVRNCLNSGSFAVKVATPASGAFHSIGGIVGMYDGISGQSVVTGCSNTGDVSLEHGTAAYFAVGGVVGSSPSGKQTPGNYGVVDNCTNEGNVSIHYINGGSGAYPNVGGVVGYTEGQLTSCINRGNISILCDSESLTWTGIRIAGVGGTVTRGASQCHNYGQITVDALCAGGTYGNRGLGNIASCCFAGVVASAGPYTADSSALFEKCYNHVDLDLTINTLTETSNHYCGGVFGYVTGTIADSENDGNITITCPTSINRLGGIAAGCCFGVSGCTNRGALVLNHPAITKTDWRSFIGGIVADASKAGATTCSNCANSGNLSFYSTATPSSSKVSALGGIVGCGAADSRIEFSNCSNNGSFEFNSSGLVVTGDLRGGDYN